MNFNVSELGKLQAAVSNLSNGSFGDGNSGVAYGFTNTVLTPLVSLLNQLSEIVKSEDSLLSDTCLKISDTINTIKSSIDTTCDEVLNEIVDYVNSTLANEAGVTQELESINSDLDGINSILSSL